MPLPNSFYTETLADNTAKSNGTPETTNFRVPITPVTAGNYAATQTALGALSGAIAAITLGSLIRNVTESSIFTAAAVPSTNPLAQRENKWLARYHDSINGQKFNVSFGTADLSLLANNSEFLDLTTGVGATLKSTFEAVVVSPNNSSDPVILDSVQFVGRNS